MKRFGGIMLMLFVSLVAVLGIFMSTNALADYSSIDKVTVEAENSTVEVHTPPIVQGSSQSQTSTKESSQAVAASGNVVGKVVEKNISPYGAGLSYNKVYVRNKTSLNINLKQELEGALQFKIEKSAGPQVLIVHTHTTESYLNEDRDYYTDSDYSRTTDEQYNMIAIGEEFVKQLTNAGIGVIHDKTLHDYPSYSGSYSRSEKTVRANLEKHPTIKVVVDIHRDSIAINDTDKTKPTIEIGGKKAAQVMLVMGSQSGSVTGFENWQQNFRLAIKYQQFMEVMYPGLARSLVLASKKYNQHITNGSMLIEVGTDVNTLEEAKYSAMMSGSALAALLNTLV